MAQCGPVEVATDYIKDDVKELQHEAENQMMKNFSMFEALKFRNQYNPDGDRESRFVKVHVGNNQCIHVKITGGRSDSLLYRKAFLLKCQPGHTPDDDIKPF
ncbi:uncharacterized protein LOC144621942 [Crassostrea virginica]